VKEKILALLKKDTNLFISGESISNKLGVSRAAIWKHMNQLKEDGYIIESVSRNGYKLIASPDLLTHEEIKAYLNTKYIGRNIIHFDSIDSTNTKAKELANFGAEDGTTIISEEQTKGRGRLGRQWCSPKSKGIWMSIILRPDIDPLNMSKLTLVAAAAVHEALMDFNIGTSIKWPNDIILGSKKLCGILTEMSGELNQINHLIIGIGVNVNTSSEEFPEELKDIATSLKSETGKTFLRTKLTASILNHFERLYEEFVLNNNLASTIAISRRNSVFLGCDVQMHNKGMLVSAKAIDIDDNGLLVIEHKDGKIEKVISGEVSMHGLYGFK
jgi:BirA family transcriptional regulator, biotin operon repressor / biotin---[acetyl-CoA-carboxylase] ligase